MSEWHDAVHTGRNLPLQPANHVLAQIGVVECYTWKKLVLQGEQEEEIIARVKAVKKESKPRPEKATRRISESSSKPRRHSGNGG